MTDVAASLSPRKRVLMVAITCCLAFPWLNPWASGPSPMVVPALVTIFCIALIWVLIPTPMVSPAWVGLALTLALVTGVLAIGSEFLPVVVALTIFSFCAGLGVFLTRANDIEQWVAGAWLLAGLLSSAIGIIQYFGISDIFAPLISPAHAGEAYANLRQRNQFATLTNIGQAALSWLVITRRMHGRTLWIAVAAAVLLSLGTAASGSRTGLLQIGVFVSLLWLWQDTYEQTDRRRAINKVLLGAVGGYALGAIALPWVAAINGGQTGIVARFSENIPPCASRMTLWANVIHLIEQRPWFGWGWGQLDYAHYVTLYPEMRFCDILDNAHSLPLHVAVELGLPIALLMFGGLIWTTWHVRPWNETLPTRQMSWTVLAMIMVHSMLEYPLWYTPFQLALGLCVGLLWRKPVPRALGVGKTSITIAVRLAFFSFLFAAIAYAAWDYYRIRQIYLMPEMRNTAYRENTLAKIQNSRLFANEVHFAELSLTPLTHANAQWTFDTARTLLHYSPEPRVIEKVIESAGMLGRQDDVRLHLIRYAAAFPQAYAEWRTVNGLIGARAD